MRWWMWSVSKVCRGPSAAAVAQVVGEVTALWGKLTTPNIRKALATRESVLIELAKLS